MAELDSAVVQYKRKKLFRTICFGLITIGFVAAALVGPSIGISVMGCVVLAMLSGAFLGAFVHSFFD